MALLKPVATYVQGLPFGPSPLKLAEPAGYGYLKRFWYSRPNISGAGNFVFYKHYHPALDMGAPIGTPIAASETSIITAIGPNPLSAASGLRYNCQIRPGTIFGGGHLNDIGTKPGTTRDWRVGDKILRGQIIGTVGMTGTASGPHVHFFIQMKVPGTSQNMLYDPLLVFPGGANANDPRIQPYY